MPGSYLVGAKYQSDDGGIYKIRVQPETAQANIGGANNPPAGAVNRQGSARVGGGNREFGVKARSVTVRFTGAAPDEYVDNPILRIPILTKALYDGINPGATGTYLGAAVSVIGKQPERVN
jgi:hypothetical protein